MDRKLFLRQLGLLSAGAFAAPSLLKTFRAEGPFYQIRNNLGYFSMRGGTIGWFVTEDTVVAIDSQYADTAAQFLEGVADYGSGPARVLFNTHHHGDHVSGNGTFAGNNYEIIAHENVPNLQRRQAEARGTLDDMTAAEITFSEEYVMSPGMETIRAKYYGNAHTGGDSVIWFENANVAHMGDLIFNRLYPFIDRDGGASIEGWINLLETVADEGDTETVYIFGHGNPEFGVTGNRDDILYMRDFLTHLLDFTASEIAAGKSREEILETTSFDLFPDHLSPSDFLSLPRNLDVAYRELTEENQ